MSIEITIDPLSLRDIFSLGQINLYRYDGDTIITCKSDDSERLIHLYENEIDGRTMYGLNKGQNINLDTDPYFVGKIQSIELSYYISDFEWDFFSLSIVGLENKKLQVIRNNSTFPEPTFIALM